MNCCDLKTLILNSPAQAQFKGIVTPNSTRRLTNGFWVVFLNPNKQPVGHYAGLYVKNDRAWFFNSLGYLNGHRQVRELLKKFKTTYNVRQLQSELTQVCALYVLYFFIRLAEGSTFERIIDEFPHDTLVNDLFVFTKTKCYYQ